MKRPKPKDVDAYIASADSGARPKLEEIRWVIKSAVPQADESISWGVPFHKHHGPLAGFAVFKNHVSMGFSVGELAGEDRTLLESMATQLEKEPCRPGSTRKCRSRQSRTF